MLSPIHAARGPKEKLRRKHVVAADPRMIERHNYDGYLDALAAD